MEAITARRRTMQKAYPANVVWTPRVTTCAGAVELHDDASGDIVSMLPDEACRLAWKLLECAAKVDADRLLRGKRR